MDDLAPPVSALLQAATAVGALELAARVGAFFTESGREGLLGLVLQVLDTSGRISEDVTAALRGWAKAAIEAKLALPEREFMDWSIAFRRRCKCALCDKLAQFLADRSQNKLEWPLATDGRQHVHQEIDERELPVGHVTRRAGRPYTLVLTKTAELFEREKAERRWLERELAKLG